MNFAKEIVESTVTELIGQSAALQTRHLEGDKRALWEQIYISALTDTRLPEWARKVIFEAEDAIDDGSLSSFSEVFGNLEHRSKRKSAGRMNAEGKPALTTLIKHCKSGGARDAETLRDLAHENNLDKTIMLSVAKENSDFLAGLKDNPDTPAGSAPNIIRALELTLRNRQTDL